MPVISMKPANTAALHSLAVRKAVPLPCLCLQLMLHTESHSMHIKPYLEKKNMNIPASRVACNLVH